MSMRNMLKVMMSLLMASLLAIALAATTGHAARLDQSLISAAVGKLNADDGRVPYYVCAMFCPGSCTCDRAAPPVSRCVCNRAGHSISSEKTAALLHTSAKIFREKNSDLIPWTECHKTCDHCACTKMWPPESNWCSCSNDGTSAPKKAATVGIQQVPKLNAVLFPREECDENCNHACACILIWPPPKYCSCGDPIASTAKCSENCDEGVCVCDSPENCSCSTGIKLSKKPAAIAVHQVAKVNAVLFPREECDENCNYACLCALIWPPPEYCSCADPIASTAKCSENCDEGVCVCDSPENCSCSTSIKLSKNPAAAGVPQVPKVKSAVFPRDECQEKCNTICACAAIEPPPAYCVCGDPKLALAM